MADVLFQEWRDRNENTKYPFSESATLINDEGDFLPNNIFLDARFYPVGGGPRQYLSKISIDADDVTFTLSDAANDLATATFNKVTPPAEIELVDDYGRPAGVIVSTSAMLSIFSGWGLGDHLFDVGEAEFSATAVIPTPQVGLRGFVLGDGSFFAKDVKLVGCDGIILTMSDGNVVVNVVGEPLFKRVICDAVGAFETPRFIKTINGIEPDNYGNFGFYIGTQRVSDPVLRLRKTQNGFAIYAVGALLHDNSRVI